MAIADDSINAVIFMIVPRPGRRTRYLYQSIRENRRAVKESGIFENRAGATRERVRKYACDSLLWSQDNPPLILAARDFQAFAPVFWSHGACPGNCPSSREELPQKSPRHQILHSNNFFDDNCVIKFTLTLSLLY